MAFVPNLDCNMLSIQKNTRDPNCVAKLLPKCVNFKSCTQGRQLAMLGCGWASTFSKLMSQKGNLKNQLVRLHQLVPTRIVQ